MRRRDAAAWGAVALVSAFALLRAFGLESVYPLVPLMAFTPYAALGGLLLAAVLAALGARAQALALLGTALLLGVLVAPRAIDGPTPVAGGPVLSVMSANLARGKVDFPTLVAEVRTREVDLLALQELTPEGVAALEDEGLEGLMPHRVVRTSPGAYGGGIYSRLPLRGQGDLTPDQWAPMPAGLARVPGGPEVRLVAPHPYPPDSLETTEDWRETIDSIPGPTAERSTIVAGDLNATLDHDALRDLLDEGYVDAADATGDGLIATWPVRGFRLPPVAIDHILVEPHVAVRSFDAFSLGGGGDHRGIAAELQLP